MEVVKKEIELPKELSEVATFVVELLKDIMAKKDVATISAENLPLLMAAVNGFDAMKDELKDEKVFDLAALLAADIAKVLKKKTA
ncbi:MAG: hypothetical protein IPI17_02035 [Nitrosomonas sp.]|nr:hypothetical protein [Nitrosomonas sp.]